jgi:predicted ester cyclase
MPQGREGARLFYQTFLAAFPDARITIEDTVSEGDKVAARFTLDATHRGEFLGMLPSGQRVSINGLSIFRFEDGHCMERWSETNLRAVLQP